MDAAGAARAETGDMPAAAACAIGGHPATLDQSGALWLPDQRVLVVSDMHLEKGTSWASRGIFLPPYDSARTLALLASAVQRFRPDGLVFLGDSFHDAGGPERLDEALLSSLSRICTMQDTWWITGNHDPQIPDFLPGRPVSELNIDGLRMVHVPTGVCPQGGELAGHLHPVAAVAGRGRAVRRRCFVTDGKRMILPAFGAYTGGLNIRDKAFSGLFEPKRLVAHVIGDRQIFSLTSRALA